MRLLQYFVGTLSMGTMALGALAASDQNYPTKPIRIVTSEPGGGVDFAARLIALATARPGELNYASGPSGSTAHLTAELFKAMAGVNMVVVPYKGSGPVIVALLGGEVLVTFSNAAAVAPHVKSGKLRALAVTSAQRSPLAPELPTVAASGLPGYESMSIYGMLAPAKIPVPIINRLNREIVQFLNQPEVKQKFLSSGVETVGNSPKEFAAAIKSDMSKLGKVIRDAGIRD